MQNGDTALHIAVKADRPDIVEALFLCGANPRLRNKVDPLLLNNIRIIRNFSVRPCVPYYSMR